MNKLRGFEIVIDAHRQHAKDIVIPQRSTSGSAGYDFISPIEAYIVNGGSIVVWTDIKAYMQADEILKIYPRSGTALKKGIVVKNSVGIIDSDYYNNLNNDGNIGICLYNLSGFTQKIEVGERIAQGIFEKFFLVDDDYVIAGRAGGFGSTGQ